MGMHATKRQRGFTLGEILTSLAVVGIGVSLAGPGLESLTGSNRQAVSVNQLVSTLHLARSEAVTRNARVTVCASRRGERCEDGRWEEGWISFVDANADQQRDPAETLIEQAPGLTGMALQSAEFEHAFSYRSTGRVAGDGTDDSTGEFSFCEPGAEQATRVVIIRASGLPALSATRRDGSPAACPEES